MRLGPMPERALRHLDGLGAAIHLLRHMHWHGLLPMKVTVPLVMKALHENRAYFALTHDEKLFGLAIWHWTCNADHQAWLQAPPNIAFFANSQSTALLSSAAEVLDDSQVWFSLLACPFGGHLQLLKELKTRMRSQVKHAWAITPYGPSHSGPNWQHPHSQARALW